MKMFINERNIKLYAVALFSALITSSCLNLDETQDGAYGYLNISGVDVDINVSELVPTKADATVDITTVRNYDNPQLSTASIKVTDSKGVEREWAGESLTLPLGSYTVTATYGSNVFDAPYFVGTASGTISDEPSSATVKFTLANSVMKVTNTIPEHYRPAASNPVTISSVNDASKKVSAAVGTYVFVPSGETLKVVVAGESTAGVEKDFIYTMTSATEARKAYNVQISDRGASMHEVTLSQGQVAWGDMIIIKTPATFKGISAENQVKLVYEAIPVPSEGTEADWSNPKVASDGVISELEPGKRYYVRARVGGVSSNLVELTPTVTGVDVSSEHTDTNGSADGGDLDGTDVKVTFTSPHAKVTAAIKEWSFEVKSTDKKTLFRTFSFASGNVSGSVNSDGSALTDVNAWPYLPQGNYTLIATAILTNNKTVSSETSIAVPAPVFGGSVSGNTTYSYYKNQGASVANGKVAETIYEIKSSVGISENILKNSNYSKPVVKYSVGSTHTLDELAFTDSKNHSLESNFEGLAWGRHELVANIKFDGVTSSNKCECHITGLPYTAAPPKNTGNYPWEGPANSWNNDYVRLHNHTISQTFHIPSNINVTVTHEARQYTRADECTYIFTVGGTECYNKDQYSVGGKATDINDTYSSVNLTTANPSVVAANSYGTIDAVLEYTNVRVYSVTVKYR